MPRHPNRRPLRRQRQARTSTKNCARAIRTMPRIGILADFSAHIAEPARPSVFRAPHFFRLGQYPGRQSAASMRPERGSSIAHDLLALVTLEDLISVSSNMRDSSPWIPFGLTSGPMQRDIFDRPFRPPSSGPTPNPLPDRNRCSSAVRQRRLFGAVSNKTGQFLRAEVGGTRLVSSLFQQTGGCGRIVVETNLKLTLSTWRTPAGRRLRWGRDAMVIGDADVDMESPMREMRCDVDWNSPDDSRIFLLYRFETCDIVFDLGSAPRYHIAEVS